MQALALLLTFGVAGLLGPFAGGARRPVRPPPGDDLVGGGRRCVLRRDGLRRTGRITLILLAFGSAVAELPFLSASRAAIPNLVRARTTLRVGEQPRDAGRARRDRRGSGARGSPAGAVDERVVGVRAQRGHVPRVARAHRERPRPVPGARRPRRDPEHEGISAGLVYLWHEPVLATAHDRLVRLRARDGHGDGGRRPAGDVSSIGGRPGTGCMIAMWGLGSTLGAGAGRWMTARTESRWLVAGVGGHRRVGAAWSGSLPLFVLILSALLTMGIVRRPHDRGREQHDAATHARRRAQPRDGGVRRRAVVRPRDRLRRGGPGDVASWPPRACTGWEASARSRRPCSCCRCCEGEARDTVASGELDATLERRVSRPGGELTCGGAELRISQGVLR